MFSTQKSKDLTDMVISDVVKVNQTSAISSGVTSNCSNVINLNGCDLDGVTIDQDCRVTSDLSTYQNAISNQISKNTLSDKIMNTVEQGTQSLGLAFTDQQSEILNKLTLNLATEVQQQHLAFCYNNKEGINKINCKDSKVRNWHVDQKVAMKGATECAQRSAMTSNAAQQMDVAVTNISKQKVENALWALAACILAVAVAIAAFFGLPAMAGGSSAAKVLNGPAALMLCSFCSLMTYTCSFALNSSKAFLINTAGIQIPPYIQAKSWTYIWIALFIMLCLSTGISFVMESRSPLPK